MSRFDWDGDDGDQTITAEMWEHNARLALKGRRGRQALRDLCEALLALPEPRLISRALCTVGRTAEAERWVAGGQSQWRADNLLEYVHSNGGEGVCAVGAYIWWKQVKAGVDPQQAFASMPMYGDDDSAPWDTARAGKDAGLSRWPGSWASATTTPMRGCRRSSGTPPSWPGSTPSWPPHEQPPEGLGAFG